MVITLDSDEVARAVEKYVRGKNSSDTPNHNYVVKMVWRGEHATVTITPKIPTLNEAVGHPHSFGVLRYPVGL